MKDMKLEIPELRNYLDAVREGESWISQIKSIRDMIVHRGYLLKPDIGFDRIEKLVVKTYKGTDYYTDVKEINIGNILTEFLRNIRVIEGSISKILLSSIDDLKRTGLTHRSKFRYAELLNEYTIEEIEADNIE